MNLQNPRFVLIIIVLLFFAPLLMAIMMRSSWWGFEPSATVNFGTLLQPPVALPLDELDMQYSPGTGPQKIPGRWVLLYPLPDDCNAHCKADIAGLRQIHIATGRNQGEVAIWLLAAGAVNEQTMTMLLALYRELHILVDSSGVARKVLESTGKTENDADQVLRDGQAFLLDPAANIILAYTTDFDPNEINRDLDRLLTWSGKD